MRVPEEDEMAERQFLKLTLELYVPLSEVTNMEAGDNFLRLKVPQLLTPSFEATRGGG